MIGDSQTLTKGADRQNAHDVEFKKAMVLLKSQCHKKGALLQAAQFLPDAKKQFKDQKIVPHQITVKTQMFKLLRKRW
ncbi:hypothetical protein [Photobacterium leiognathi]|uniref:hypothetical protein n=1 Tax=Photobacterium leiognathi TaxID=553611 RepID=UPI002734DE1B|nr:hypothetical protein [Photobacterium leiognathi]